MKTTGLWKEGETNGYKYQAKVYDEGSNYGINGGRVSKLWVTKNGKEVINYDRGWDLGKNKRNIWQPIVDSFSRPDDKNNLLNEMAQAIVDQAKDGIDRSDYLLKLAHEALAKQTGTRV